MLQPKIAKKFTKTFILGVQGHLRSSMLTFLRSSLPVLMISSISVPICNYFYTRQQVLLKRILAIAILSVCPS